MWTTQDYLYVTAECLVGALSMLGNSLVLVAIAKTRSMRTITNCFIGSLAAADVLVGLIIPPVVILPYRGWPPSFYGCVMMNSMVVLITNISILSLLGVALERYMAISDPFRYHRLMSVKRALMLVALIWVVAILIGLAPILGWSYGTDHFAKCSFTEVITMEYMVYLVFFGVTLLPLLLMMIVYCYIFHIVRKQQRAVAQVSICSEDSSQQQEKKRREVRGAKGLAYVIILFAVCWMPIHILNCVTLFAPDHKASLQWHLVAIVLSHANSVVNPFLYAFGYSQFKVVIIKMLLCGRCKHLLSQDAAANAVDSRYRTMAARDIIRRKSTDAWSKLDVANIVPTNSLPLGILSNPRASISSDPGVLNRGFSAEETHPPEQQAEPIRPTLAHGPRRSLRQSKTVVISDLNKNCQHDSSEIGHFEASTAMHVASAGGGPSSRFLKGRTAQLWVTRSSNPRHLRSQHTNHHNHHHHHHHQRQPSSATGGEAQTLGQAPPAGSSSSASSSRHQNGAGGPQLADGARAERADSSSGSPCFVSIRL